MDKNSFLPHKYPFLNQPLLSPISPANSAKSVRSGYNIIVRYNRNIAYLVYSFLTEWEDNMVKLIPASNNTCFNYLENMSLDTRLWGLTNLKNNFLWCWRTFSLLLMYSRIWKTGQKYWLSGYAGNINSL